MRLVEDQLVWSASDLTTASRCEYSLLRRVDQLLGRGDPAVASPDPLMDQLARIGERHEAAILDRFRTRLPEGRLVELHRAARGASTQDLYDTHRATVQALSGEAEVVYQAGFFDGSFSGFADFLVREDDGWVVADAKLSRQARPTALLQVTAYAEQVEAAGLPLADRVRLLLGDGRDEDFSLHDLRPVLVARRQRLLEVVHTHAEQEDEVLWGRDDLLVCGSCAECSAAMVAHRDLLLVAGMRQTQRRALREAGIQDLDALALSDSTPPGVAKATFAKLRAQAALQRQQLDAGPGPKGQEQVSYEVLEKPASLAMLPPPSAGDIFFDFEGDPLYQEDDPRVWGLEYLWGVIEAPIGDAEPEFRAWWAHDRVEEKQAFVAFMNYVAARRAAHPDMHIYHYAPYETTALKRLAARYATHETEVDDLLRSVVFVDLYAVVRGAVRVSQPSYSIKKLEPLYMSDEDRSGMDVAAGDASIAEYHESRQLAEDGEAEKAQAKLDALRDYNRYDCLSTLRLRDWLLEIKAAAAPGSTEAEGDHADGQKPAADEEHDQLVTDLMVLASEVRSARTPEEQGLAMLASAIGYHRREGLPFWWEHFSRLGTPEVADWQVERDVFRVTSHDVLEDWQVPQGKQTPRRRLLLHGSWGAGSRPGSNASLVYGPPPPAKAKMPSRGFYAWAACDTVVAGSDDETVEIVETLRKVDTPHPAAPVALTPAEPPSDSLQRAAIRELAAQAVAAGGLLEQPAMDVLRRAEPRTTSGVLPRTGDVVDDLVASLLDLQRSYLAVQGPPGTGKTYTGSRVIKRLVEEHGWRIGVVAQSHAVVENMLQAVVDAGLNPERIGKKATRAAGARWRDLETKGQPKQGEFVSEATGGCVLGGTAWTFTGKQVEREQLDLLIIDEAGQFSLADTLAVSVATTRMLLLGDPQQLPQVSQGTHGEPVDESALGWLMKGHDTLPAALGYFLETTYRMHPELCARVSRLSYGGRLNSAPVAATRSLEGVAPGLRTVHVRDHHGAATASPEEAQAVVEQVRAVLGRAWHESGETRPLGQSDVLVVAPYNAQVHLILKRLAEAGLPDVRVGTVDKFQGQQAPVVIVSMTASSPDDVPRGMGFLLSRNRVNVAVSRAQWLAVVVQSPRLTSYLPPTTHGLLELGAYFGLVNSPHLSTVGSQGHDERAQAVHR